jgi:carboxyl-terminal processing protease
MQNTKTLAILTTILGVLIGFVAYPYIISTAGLGPTITQTGTKLLFDGPTRLSFLSKEQSAILEQLHTTLVGEYIDGEKLLGDTLFEWVMRGMTEAVNDKHTQFFNREETDSFNAAIRQNFEGIGAVVGESASGVVIRQILPESPAQRAKLLPWEVITQVWTGSLAGKTVEASVALIKWPAGSQVELTVSSTGATNTQRKVKITRAAVTIPSISSKMVDPKTGYIRVGIFWEKTTQEFEKSLKDITASGAQNLIVDLRGNPGGLLTGATDLLDIFVPKGLLLVETRGRSAGLNEKIFSDQIETQKLALVVLVDENSASAAEIFAGAIQDHKLGRVIGRKTYGKWSVQEVFLLQWQGEVKVTVARWYTPSGRGIDGIGITPDDIIPISEVDLKKEEDLDINAAKLYFKKLAK